MEGLLLSKLEALLCSEELEVQERASSSLHLLKYVARQREKGELEAVKVRLSLASVLLLLLLMLLLLLFLLLLLQLPQAELATFFSGELNPVAPKAQRKVQGR